MRISGIMAGIVLALMIIACNVSFVLPGLSESALDKAYWLLQWCAAIVLIYAGMQTAGNAPSIPRVLWRILLASAAIMLTAELFDHPEVKRPWVYIAAVFVSFLEIRDYLRVTKKQQ